MNTLLYAEVNIVEIITLSIILFCIKMNMDFKSTIMAFRRAVIATICILFLDVFWILINGTPTKTAYFFNNIVNILYMINTGIISCLWLFYIIRKIDLNIKLHKKTIFYILLPLIILSIASVLSPFTGWIFYIDENNLYHRGSMFFIQYLISYGYLVFATLYLLKVLHYEKNYYRRTELKTLFAFVILPLIGAIINAFTLLPTVWPATSLSLLMIYINFQSYQISTDSLTGLNNRRQFDKHIYTVTSESHRTDRIFLFMMDVNYFKSINDTFGHLEGDKALIRTANLLCQVCMSKRAFLARYGGDEFAIVYRCQTEDEADLLKDQLISLFCETDNKNEVPYPLSISIGFAEFSPGKAENIFDLIEMADNNLYAEKQKFKSLDSNKSE